jgi:hypothetical protein
MSRKTLTVPCLLDIEVTPESVHAHAVPEGVTSTRVIRCWYMARPSTSASGIATRGNARQQSPGPVC